MFVLQRQIEAFNQDKLL